MITKTRATGRMPTRARSEAVYDLVGVGVGPSDLSLPALADPVPDARTVFFEVMLKFRWQPGLLDGDALIQTFCLKDLVTPTDPTSRYSFLTFLIATRRLYRFLNLSLVAWRSAVIVNSLCGPAVYDVRNSNATITWPRDQTIQAEDETKEMLSVL